MRSAFSKWLRLGLFICVLFKTGSSPYVPLILYINAIRFCLGLLCTESRDVQIELSTVTMYCEEKLVSEILIY